MTKNKIVLIIILIAIFHSCKSDKKKMQEVTTPSPVRHADPHSCARPDESSITHLSLELTVDFQKKILHGSAKFKLINSADADELFLDTRDLNVEKVLADGSPVNFKLGDTATFLGKPLRISITPDTKDVTVFYSTSPEAAALQWLSPEQTAGGKNPFLFTQSQAISGKNVDTHSG